MTNTGEFPVGTQRELRTSWRAVVGPLGFDTRSLWIALIDARHRLRGEVLEIADIPIEPTPGDAAQIERFLDGFVGSDLRVAALLSRSGQVRPLVGDRAWAAVLYDACWAVGVPCTTVHLASDVDIIAVPIDDVADLLNRLAC